MARSLPFFLVDVFADAPLTGNPLAVVADADKVDEDLMRAIAREFRTRRPAPRQARLPATSSPMA
jgi:predicted PhzF superfamily epimerase YddE/YHI9